MDEQHIISKNVLKYYGKWDDNVRRPSNDTWIRQNTSYYADGFIFEDICEKAFDLSKRD